MSFKKELNKRNRKKRLYKKWIKISDKINIGSIEGTKVLNQI